MRKLMIAILLVATGTARGGEEQLPAFRGAEGFVHWSRPE